MATRLFASTLLKLLVLPVLFEKFGRGWACDAEDDADEAPVEGVPAVWRVGRSGRKSRPGLARGREVR